jgi:hypothetical protein
MRRLLAHLIGSALAVNYASKEGHMRMLANILIILAAVGLLIGLVIRLMKGAFLWDQVFFWRGSMALLVLAIAIALSQIRDK